MATSRRPAWRSVLEFVLNLLTAVVGVAIVNAEIYVFYVRAGTDHGMVSQELTLSAMVAAILGCVAELWRQTTARWIWTVPGAVFLCALIFLPSESVPSFSQPMKSDLWATGCHQVHGMSCTLFYALTVPAVRASCYSIGAAIASRFR